MIRILFLKKASLFILFFSLISFIVKGNQDYYWIGDNGKWNDPANWSLTSGGKPAGSVPGKNDDVHFDGNSFSSNSIKITLKRNVKINSLYDSTKHSISFYGSKNVNLTISGDLHSSKRTTFNLKGNLILDSYEDNILNTNRAFIKNDLIFKGGGEWKLKSSLQLYEETALILKAGIIDFNTYFVKTSRFISKTDKKRGLIIRNSNFIVSKKIDVFKNNLFTKIDKGKLYLTKNKIEIPNDTILKENQSYRSASSDCFDQLGNPGCGGSPCSIDIDIIPLDSANCNGNDICCGGGRGDFKVAVTSCNGCSGDYTFEWLNINNSDTIDAAADDVITDSVDTLENVADQSQIEVEVTDNGTGDFCKDKEDIDVPSTITQLVLNEDEPTCPDTCDGALTYVPDGGIDPYDFDWSNGDTCLDALSCTADSLCLGEYNLLITDQNGCTKRDTVDMTGPDTIMANMQLEHDSCNNTCVGNAESFPTGGNSTGTYDFSWSTSKTTLNATDDSIDFLCDGSYSLTIEDDSGCTKDTSFNITEPPPLNSTITDTVNLLCSSECIGEVSAVGSGGTPDYKLELYDATQDTVIDSLTSVAEDDTMTFDSLCALDYYVKVTDSNGCEDRSSTVSLTEPPPLSADTQTTNITCKDSADGTITVQGTGGAGKYQYQLLGNNASDSTLKPSPATTDSIVYDSLSPGCYDAVVRDTNGCRDTTFNICITEPNKLQ
ncbi:MAG: SprB repeat-containing protein, partial [Flavobacteriales bacterium]